MKELTSPVAYSASVLESDAKAPQTSEPVPWRSFLGAWARVAALSFGGPAGQIAVMHRIVVEEQRWVRDNRFLHALNYCMLLPGPEAQQLAVYLGWLQRGVLGGLVAGGLFVLPGFVSILALSLIYSTYGATAAVSGLFYGLKASVLAVVADAVRRIGKRSLRTPLQVAVAITAFVASFFLAAPFPALVVAAAVLGFLVAPWKLDWFQTPGGRHGSKAVEPFVERHPLPGAAVQPTWRRAAVVAGVGLTLWWGPVAALIASGGTQSVYCQQALLFSKAAVVTFGGAYSVLGYVAHEAVVTHHWLKPPEMLDGLAMAESTPGPLIQVVQFVGYMASYRNPGELSPLAAGVLGSVVTTWVTFVPCFLWIFLGAPYVERLQQAPRLSAALASITSAVVGVIASLGVWLAIHTLFGRSWPYRLGPVALEVPDWRTIDPLACALFVASAVAIQKFRSPAIAVLGASAVIGVLRALLTA